MKIFKTIAEIQHFRRLKRESGQSVGLVPTMGALHAGHISLIGFSKKDNPVTIASVFVNPIQFNNPADLEKYPRTLENDIKMLEDAGCDALFAPDAGEMYPAQPSVKMEFGRIEQVMEGAFRPGHFSGVGVVVSKLFNIVQPDHAYFGQKDLQQVLVIRQMVRDLSFPVTLHSCPIMREADGLAMSSRNVRLSADKRPVAAKIYESLQLASDKVFREGVTKTKQAVAEFYSQYPELEPEYFEIADAETLESVKDPAGHTKIALCAAVYLDGVRLIDNMLLTRIT